MIGLPWLLVDETIDDGDNVVAACADIDGLFAPVSEPPLERYSLLDCRPTGRLRAACDGTGPLWVGNIGLEALGSPDLDQELLDVTVVSALRESRHGPLDVVLSGRMRAGTRKSPDKMGYKLAGVGFDEDFGLCGDIDGVCRQPPAPLPRPATLLGCRPGTRLQRAIDALERGAASRHRRWVHASVFSVAHDGTATRLLDAGLGAEVSAVRPSSLGEGLVDVEFQPTYADAIGPPRPQHAGDVWERWRDGRPAMLASWASYDRELRQEWAGAALAHHRHGVDVADGVFELDGRHITDEEGFYCAIGEAVNGPGGYFGWNLGALHDCLQGGWGAAPGFQLIWHDSAIARASLKPGYDRRWWAPALTMDQLVGLLTVAGVDVDLR
ncbi:RNAse (barnase) inhibitor barstar [Actinoplanes lutulentus]|uniref:Barstar (Barnase inhibitor) n=1 Tax=Actinoplanes lutulentus TaxID=1287878 RepID=A0A327YY41_9ACTN|nr:barstar family protein [Actinoplanes lutulentus]MBB2943144.1 RNAse (barnase) inhibitor barstar [Actinoplanes lutulentus]RAK25561.1 barstar (barnase inhibitor) [Actinoplanes lutulentus]